MDIKILLTIVLLWLLCSLISFIYVKIVDKKESILILNTYDYMCLILQEILICGLTGPILVGIIIYNKVKKGKWIE